MRRLLALAAAAAVTAVAGCTTTTTSGTAQQRPGPSGAARGASAAGPAGCGATTLSRGRPPAWTNPGWANSANTAPPPIVHAVSAKGEVAGFLFSYPLMAGNPVPYSDKILWVVRLPRDGQPLTVTGHPLGAPRPAVSTVWAADSQPGEIYPSEIQVPRPGCWTFTVAWNGHSDTLDLPYVAHR